MLHSIKDKILYFKKLKVFNKNLKSFEKGETRFTIEVQKNKTFLFEDTATTNFDGHYVYHPAWAARIVKEINPEVHVDISSTLNFSTILSAFIPTKFYDFRPAKLNLSNLSSNFIDLNALSFETNSIPSLSCMHTIEHVGLSRYGDKLDNEGDLKAIKELKRVVTKGGNLLIVVPIGKPKIIFHAHRIYSYKQIISYFDGFALKNFSLITDNNDFINPSNEIEASMQNYGCGCFWFVKDNNGV